uniref:class I SAM-dependent methyltransferase n=1 Tax=Salinibacterium sp. TMP30 TaxID=3138237 RepID=UPI00405486BA
MSSSVIAEFGAGTGTGQFTLEAAHVCARVIAVDVSPPILRHLQRKVTDRGLANVDLVRAGFLSYVHAGNPIGFVGYFARAVCCVCGMLFTTSCRQRRRCALRSGALWAATVLMDSGAARSSRNIYEMSTCPPPLFASLVVSRFTIREGEATMSISVGCSRPGTDPARG